MSRRTKPRKSGQQSKRWRKQQRAFNEIMARVNLLRSRRRRFIDVWTEAA